MLYAAAYLREQSAAALGIVVTQQLTAPIFAFRRGRRGESVGYGASWVAQRETRVAVVALGYGDGYPRHAPSHTPVAINGQRTHLAGRVSMDMLTDRKSTRLNSSHVSISYAVFCLEKKQ